MSKHLVPLEDGWSLWRNFCVRGSGFPAAWVLKIAASSLEADAASVEQAEVQKAGLKELGARALSLCDAAIKASSGETRTVLRRVRRRIEVGKPLVEAERTVLEEPLKGAMAELDQVRAGASSPAGHLEQEYRAVREALLEMVRDDRFREAMIWQNRRVVERGVNSLLRQSADATDSQARQNEQLVASYVQRYATKNESIGFFGPIGWGTVRSEGSALEMRPGPALLSKRTLYFEYWGVDALAAKLSEDPEIKPWLMPRRVPTARAEGTTAYLSADRSFQLPELQARLFAACEGKRTAKALAERLAPELGTDVTLDQVYEALKKLEEMALITWTLEPPSELAHPERGLLDLLELVGDEKVRGRAMALLGEVLAKRDALARAAGTGAEAVDRAMEDLEQTFQRVTGLHATRRPGQVYAARQLVYEDTCRDLELSFGPDVVKRLAPSLTLLLKSSRWFTHEVATGYREIIEDAYPKLVEETGSQVVDCSRLLGRVGPHFAKSQYKAPPVVDRAVEELKSRWTSILQVPEKSSGPVIVKSSDIAAAVEKAFAAPGPGWPGARYHSPDLMIAAKDGDALRQGDWFAVLGEVHPGLHSALNIPPLLVQAPHREQLIRDREEDIPMRCIAPVVSKQSVDRAAFRSPTAKDLHVELDASRSWLPRDQVLALADLVVDRADGKLRVRTRSGDHTFDPIAFFQHYLVICTAGHFSVAPSRKHVPRLVIDSLVVSRERWKFAPAEIPFADTDSRGSRLKDAARWAEKHGIPRFFFVKVPHEPKPFYVDLRSPPLVELFAKAVRKAKTVSVSEMLPAHGQTWLEDAEGQQYTCEFRMAALDPVQWRPVERA